MQKQVDCDDCGVCTTVEVATEDGHCVPDVVVCPLCASQNINVEDQ